MLPLVLNNKQIVNHHAAPYTQTPAAPLAHRLKQTAINFIASVRKINSSQASATEKSNKLKI